MPVFRSEEDDESRTLSVGVKRQYSASEGRSLGYSTPSKRRRRHQVECQVVSDFVPKGGAFPKSEEFMQPLSEESNESMSSSSPAPDQLGPRTMNWNQGVQGTIRTSLRGNGGNLGQNRLASGFSKHHAVRIDGATSSSRSRAVSNADSSTGESPDEAIEISDDTDMESDSEGGMMINVEAHAPPVTQLAPVSNQDSEDEGLVSDDSNDPNRSSHASSPRSSPDGDAAHNQLQVDLERSFVIDPAPTTTTTAASNTKLKLADLSHDEFERQMRYTLFHMDRNEIDLNRPVVCTSCLKEGHLENICSETNCTYCGQENSHPSRLCPRYRRCLRCRERGHDIKACTSKLKDSSVPCDYCGSDQHLENTCSMRFFPVQSSTEGIQFRLWISCCNCGSNTHLVGDCPRLKTSMSARWSLKSLDRHQVTNLSLESGTRRLEKEAMNRGMRPQGLKIKGHADLHQAGSIRSSVADDDEQFLRPRVGQPSPRRGSGQIKFGRSVGDSRASGATFAFSGGSRNDRFDPPNDDHHYTPRGRGQWYATDSFGSQRRRSRSPDSDQYRNSYRPPTQYGPGAGYGGIDSYHPHSSRPRDLPRRPPSPHGFDTYRPQNNEPLSRRPASPKRDNWRPPLPREPLPEGPPPPGSRAQLPTRQGSSQWAQERSKPQPQSQSQQTSQSGNGQRHNTAAQNANQVTNSKLGKKARKRAEVRKAKGKK